MRDPDSYKPIPATDCVEFEQMPQEGDTFVSTKGILDLVNPLKAHRNWGGVYLPPPISPPSFRQVEELTEQNIVLGDGRAYTVVYPMGTPMGEPCPSCGAWNMCVGDAMYLGECVPCSRIMNEEWFND